MANLEEKGAEASVEASLDDMGVPVVSISGELDMSNAEAVSVAIEAVIDDQANRVIFELGALTFMDSTGITLLLEVCNRVGSIEVRSPTSTVRRVIEITGLAETFGLVP